MSVTLVCGAQRGPKIRERSSNVSFNCQPFKYPMSPTSSLHTERALLTFSCEMTSRLLTLLAASSHSLIPPRPPESTWQKSERSPPEVVPLQHARSAISFLLLDLKLAQPRLHSSFCCLSTLAYTKLTLTGGPDLSLFPW